MPSCFASRSAFLLSTLVAFPLTIVPAQAQGPGRAPGPPPATVIVAEIVEEPVEPSQTFVGTVMPRRRTVVGSAVDGRVVEFLAEEGTRVTKGQPLTQLLTATIQIELEAAKAELELRQQEHAKLVKTLPEDIAQARARQEQAKATAEFAQARERRSKSLFDRGPAISEEDMQEVRSTGRSAQQAHVAAEAALRAASSSQAEDLAQSQAKVRMQQEQVNLLEDRLNKFTIKAPFDGYVVAEYTEVGAWVKQGDRIAEIIELAQVEVSVDVPEAYLIGLMEVMAAAEDRGEAATADVRLRALDVHRSVTTERGRTGQVSRIVPQASPRSRTFAVKVVVENVPLRSNFLFQAGMLAHVTLPVGVAEKGTTLVPKDALVLMPDATYVCLAAKNPQGDGWTARRVPVTVGLTKGDRVHVVGDGIVAGEQVVVRGNERLLPGQPIQIAAE